nr:transcription factor FapR [Paenibacillus pasadenensis]
MSKVVQVIERLPKKQRHQQLLKHVEDNPFMTDRELTRLLKVSIQTIRLDRMELGIPELRERLKLMAERSYDPVRSLQADEVIGEIVDLQLDKSGISIFEIGEEHAFSRSGIARGHHLFAQANSLAVAVINDEVALTATADIRFLRPVRLGEKCIAKAYVRRAGQRSKAKVEVFSYVGDELVLEGQFMIHRSGSEASIEGGDEH